MGAQCFLDKERTCGRACTAWDKQADTNRKDEPCVLLQTVRRLGYERLVAVMTRNPERVVETAPPPEIKV